MNLLKPTEHIEKRYKSEIVLELILIFIIISTIIFVAPIYIGAKRKRSRSINTFVDKTSTFLYNKDGRSYPFLGITASLGTILYYLSQLRNKKAVAFLFEEEFITIVYLNTFSGAITRIRFLRKNFKATKHSGGYTQSYYKIFNKNKRICDFYPKFKPWNEKRDLNTINKILEEVENNRNS